MRTERLEGEGDLFEGTTRLGRVRYRISSTTPTTPGEGLGVITGRLLPPKKGARADLFDAMNRSAHLTLHLEGGGQWAFYISELDIPSGIAKAVNASGRGVDKLRVTWVGQPPEDADEWENIVNFRASEIIGVGEARIAQEAGGWRIVEATIGGIGIGMGPYVPTIPPPLDIREQLTEALRSAGKPVL